MGICIFLAIATAILFFTGHKSSAGITFALFILADIVTWRLGVRRHRQINEAYLQALSEVDEETRQAILRGEWEDDHTR